MRSKQILIALASLACLPAALFSLVGTAPSEVPTIEQVLAREDVAEIERIRGIFGHEPDSMLVAIRNAGGPTPRARLDRIEEELRSIDGIARTWSFGAGGGVSVIVVALEPGAIRLTRSRALTAAVDRALARVTEAGETVRVIGTPQLRTASWAAAENDLWRMLPLLVLVVVLVPLAFFSSFDAIFFPLVMAALTTTASLVAYRLFCGPLNALVMLLIPILWSVATLDAMHLYHRVRSRTGADAVAAARTELFWPCLLTTVTTVGGLLALAVQDESRLIRSFGLWAAVGTCLAFFFTFTIGGALLELAGRDTPSPRWPARLALHMTRFSQRRAGAVLIVWSGVLVAAGIGAARLTVDVRFPRIFAPNHPMARELADLQAWLGTDLSPLEIYIEPTDEHGRRPLPLARAMALVTHQLETYAETRAVFPKDLLAEQTVPVKPGLLEPQLKKLDRDPRVAPWVRFDRGAARVQAHFAPMSFSRRNEIVRWLRHFDSTMLDHHRLSFGGPGFHYALAERRALRGTLIGGVLSLLVVAGTLASSFRRPRVLAAALIGNLAPLLIVAGAMGAAGLPWSLAVIPLPAVLLGLAVDDTVHLLWPLRAGHSIARGAIRAGPALLATTAVLAGSVATLTLSGLQVNRELGILLPGGLLLALLCDLSLVPALVTFSRRRSARRRP